jgi:hypothetical protein
MNIKRNKVRKSTKHACVKYMHSNKKFPLLPSKLVTSNTDRNSAKWMLKAYRPAAKFKSCSCMDSVRNSVFSTLSELEYSYKSIHPILDP